MRVFNLYINQPDVRGTDVCEEVSSSADKFSVNEASFSIDMGHSSINSVQFVKDSLLKVLSVAVFTAI